MRSGRLSLLTVLLVVAGCTQPDTNPDWNPSRDLPPWAYDAPFYYRPSEDLEPVETIGEGIPVYYVRDDYFFIRHPGGYQVNGTPRVAVWCSVDAGETWNKAGYYGVEQSHFLLRARDDAPHWIRFVGPGQGVTEIPPGMPHRIYVADRDPPRIAVEVRPSPWTDEEKKVPRVYEVGEVVHLRWAVRDEHLTEPGVELGTCFAEFPMNTVWNSFPEDLPPTGTMDIELPAEAVRDGGLRFRIRAVDKAGNVGIGLTDTLHIEGEEGVRITRTPVGSDDPVIQFANTPGEKPGWPTAGEMIRGGVSRYLRWLPPDAADYGEIEMEFSANNGQTWRTVATGLKPSALVKWRVPPVTTQGGRLRITGEDESGHRAVLATSQQFYVETAMPETIFGPQESPERKSYRVAPYRRVDDRPAAAAEPDRP